MKLSARQYKGWRLRRKTTFRGNPLYSFETIIPSVLIRQKKRLLAAQPRVLKPIIFRLDILWIASRELFRLNIYSMKAHPDYVQFHPHIYVSKIPDQTWICWGRKGDEWRITESKSLREILESHLMAVTGVLADYSSGDRHTLQIYMDVWSVPIGKNPDPDGLLERLEKVPFLPSSFWGGEG